MKQLAKRADETPVIYLMEMPNGGASDVALKKHMVDISEALGRVCALRPVTWYWKSDMDNRDLQHGFIAQEVEKIFPDLIQERPWPDGTKRKYLSTKGLIPYLVQAIGEQQKQLDELRAKLESTDRQ